MKKQMRLIILVLSGLLIGCAPYQKLSDVQIDKPNQVQTDTEDQTDSVEAYFPSQENLHWRYKGEGNEYADFERYLIFSSEHKIQLQDHNGGTVAAKVLEIQKDAITLLYQKEEAYHRRNLLNENNVRDILLKAPIEVGNTWEDMRGNKRYIEAVDALIKTPMETYSTVKVVTEEKDSIMESYYAKEVGLVKQVTRAKDGAYVVTSTLEKISQKPQVQQITLYYPDASGKMIKKQKEVYLNTNESIIYPLIKELKTKPQEADLAPVLTKNVKLNSVLLDPQKNILHIDLSKEFVTDMNLGSGFEMLTINSFVNTVLDNYGMQEMLLTIEGKPLSTGHIALSPGETLKKNEEDLEVR